MLHGDMLRIGVKMALELHRPVVHIHCGGEYVKHAKACGVAHLEGEG